MESYPFHLEESYINPINLHFHLSSNNFKNHTTLFTYGLNRQTISYLSNQSLKNPKKPMIEPCSPLAKINPSLPRTIPAGRHWDSSSLKAGVGGYEVESDAFLAWLGEWVEERLRWAVLSLQMGLIICITDIS